MSVRLERLIRIYNRLRRGPVTIDIISKWARSAGIKVSDRQLYRDLNSLQNLHVAEGENILEYIDEKNRKTWKLEYEEDGEKISQYDINSFFLFKNFVPYTIYEQRKDSMEKFEKIIYKSFSKNKYQQLIQANELYLKRTNYFDNMYGAIEHKQIEDLIWALHNKRTIIIESIDINPANIHLKKNSFPLPMHPMELMFHRGRVYISGLSPADGKLLIFAVDKTLRFSLTNQIFNREKLLADYETKTQALFGISDPVNKKLYQIKIEFTSGYAHSWMNYFWHHSQRWQPLKNGNYMLHLHCGIGRELFGFLAYGLDKVKVHQPKILKEILIEKLKGTIAVYEEDLEIDEDRANRVY